MKKHSVTLMLAILFGSFQLFSQSKPITHEGMWLMKRVGAPQISPDGKWVVYSVTEPSYDEKEVVNDLWMVPADGSSAPRKITGGKGGESGYAWSPDGSMLAFTTRRDADESAQLYLLPLKSGGEAQRITNLSTGVGGPEWSPDGKRIAFTSRVWPGAYNDSISKKKEEEKKKIKYKARVYTGFPVREWDHWLDEKQTHLYVQEIAANGKLNNLFTAIPLMDSTGFSFGGDFSFTPDGNAIVFSATTDGRRGAFMDGISNLYMVGVDGKNFKQLTNDGNSYGRPEFSADGKSLLCIASAENNYKVYNLGKLARFNWPAMQGKALVAPALDRPINSYSVIGNMVYMSVEDQGRDKLMSVSVSGGQTQMIAPGTKGCYTNMSVSDNGTAIVANYENLSAPPEVVKINGAAAAHTNLSNANTAALATFDLPQPEEIWTTTSRGKKVRSMVLKPAGFDASKKYPLFVLMHGGPAISFKENWGYRWNAHVLAAPGYVIVMTDYTGSTGYGEKFTQDIQYDPFEGPGKEIQEAAADAIKRFAFIDGSRQAAGGASYGGHLASWMQASTSHYKCLVNHAGLVNSEVQWGTSDYMYGREVMNGGTPWMNTPTFQKQNPIRKAANFKTPMLLTVGELDYRVPLNNTLENWAIHQRLKIPSKLIVFPEENHWILKAENSRFHYQSIHEWLAQWLK